jgi:hypothetical protein
VSGVFEHLDEVLVRVMRQRDELLADPAAVDRSTRLAALFDSEARTWSQLFELSSLRLVWRAALAAEAGARANAQLWARRAAAEVASPCARQVRAVGRVEATAPRPVALPTSSAPGRR